MGQITKAKFVQFLESLETSKIDTIGVCRVVGFYEDIEDDVRLKVTEIWYKIIERSGKR